MRVLVTGGAGFIGSAVCRRLVLDKGWDVLNVDKLTRVANLRSLEAVDGHPHYQFVQADICDRQMLDVILAEFLPDAVFHLAAESHVDRSITNSTDFIRTNIVGTHVLLEALLDYWSRTTVERRERFRFLHVSTDEVYGSLGACGHFVEQTPYDPHSPYAASKAASDHLVMAWHATYGLPALISNCTNNYGPFQFPEKLIPLTILNAIEQKPIAVYGDGCNVRDWLHVDDHVRALVLIFSQGRVGHRYNVGGWEEHTNRQVVETICNILDELRPSARPHHDLIRFVSDRPGHDRRYAIDPSKIREELGWRAQIPFSSGLRQTVRWYLDNPTWWRTVRDQGYAGERIGVLEL